MLEKSPCQSTTTFRIPKKPKFSLIDRESNSNSESEDVDEADLVNESSNDSSSDSMSSEKSDNSDNELGKMTIEAENILQSYKRLFNLDLFVGIFTVGPVGGEVNMDNFITVKLPYEGRQKIQTTKYFIAKVVEIVDDGFSCSFMRQIEKRNSFHFPNIEDIWKIKKDNIITILGEADFQFRRGYLSLISKNKVTKYFS